MSPGPGSDRPGRPVVVVLLSGDASVAEALKDALPDVPGDLSMKVAADAEAALEALPGVGDGERFRTVPVALLDVDAQPEAARAVLEALKDDPRHRRIPVLALAHDPAGEDAKALYDAHANAVVQRAGDTDQLTAQLVELLTFWLTVPALP